MPTPASGLIKLSQIQTEFGGANPISMGEYYSNAPSGYTTGVAGIPASGNRLRMSNFYGKSKPAQIVVYPPISPAWAANGSITSYNGGISTVYSGTLSGQAYGNGTYTLRTNDQVFKPISNLFDRSTTLQYTADKRYLTNVDTSPTGWFSIVLPGSVAVSSYRMQWFGVRARPTKWVLYGGTNHANWVAIHTVNSFSWPANPSEFTINSSTPYNSYMFECFRVNAPNDPVWYFELTEFWLYSRDRLS